MDSEIWVLIGSLVTAVGVVFLGVGSTDGRVFPWSKKPLIPEKYLDPLRAWGTAAGIAGAILLAIGALVALL